MTATKRYRAYDYGSSRLLPAERLRRMIADIHSFQLVLLCQISKSAPNILWSVGSSLQNQFLQAGGGSPAVIVAKISLKSMLERRTRRLPRAAEIAKKALTNKALRA